MNKSKIPAAQKSVLGLLLDDHKAVKKLFKDFEAEKDAATKEEIARQACTELTTHTEIEEKKFYPFLREQDPDAFGDLLDEAVVEHASAKDLIAQITSATMEDDLYEAKVTVLSEYVDHHVTEEEDELFTKVISKKVDLRDLYPQMTALKKEITGE